jgi:hypothetical protein
MLSTRFAGLLLALGVWALASTASAGDTFRLDIPASGQTAATRSPGSTREILPATPLTLEGWADARADDLYDIAYRGGYRGGYAYRGGYRGGYAYRGGYRGYYGGYRSYGFGFAIGSYYPYYNYGYSYYPYYNYGYSYYPYYSYGFSYGYRSRPYYHHHWHRISLPTTLAVYTVETVPPTLSGSVIAPPATSSPSAIVPRSSETPAPTLPRAESLNGTFPYNGGPQTPVPMPRIEEGPPLDDVAPSSTTFEIRPADRLVSLPEVKPAPAKGKWTFPAYGEEAHRTTKTPTRR